jgi:NAD/NADP transhydrogenase alpha subunit
MWAAITYAPAGTDRVSAALFSAAGFLGLSWAGVGATLGRALRQAESAMWKAEVVSAIGKAATITRGNRKIGRNCRKTTNERPMTSPSH